jgi:hypothetical protein
MVRGRGPSLTGVGSNYVSDPSVTFSLNGADVYNDDWTGFYDTALITGRYSGLNNKDSAYYGVAADDAFHSAIISGATGTYNDKRARLDVMSYFGTNPLYKIPQTTASGTGVGSNEAWLMYYLRTGAFEQQNHRNVFAYSISILDYVSGGNFDISEDQTTGSVVSYSGYDLSGYCSTVSLLLQNTGKNCSSEPTGENIEICLENTLSSGEIRTQIADKMREILQGITNGGESGSSSEGMQTSSVYSPFKQYQGEIIYNTPVYGDYIEFNAYDFPYTGTYSGIFDAAPPYDEIYKKWYYQDDYDGIDSLVNLINTELSGTEYWLWNNIDCYEGLTGYYEYGPLLKATKVTENKISIESLRYDAAGKYSISAYNVARPYSTKHDIVKFLLPNRIRLQATNSTGSGWNTLLTRTGINWSSLTPTQKIVYHTGVYFSEASGEALDEQEEVPNEYSVTGGLVNIPVYAAVISGKDKCGTEMVRNVLFYQKPTGFNARCQESGDGGNEEDLTDELQELLSEDPERKFLVKNYLRTGWRDFSSTG